MRYPTIEAEQDLYVRGLRNNRICETAVHYEYCLGRSQTNKPAVCIQSQLGDKVCRGRSQQDVCHSQA